MFKAKMSELNTKISKAILLNEKLNGEDYYNNQYHDLIEEWSFDYGENFFVFNECASFLANKIKVTKISDEDFIEDPDEEYEEEDRDITFTLDISKLEEKDVLGNPLLYIRKGN